jgi:hypothetical protein
VTVLYRFISGVLANSSSLFTVRSLGLIWLAESTAGWFFVREKKLLANLADNLKRTGC